MLNGTSMASPQAAGAAALLISAAKQQNVQKQPDQLRQALTSSARFLDTSRFGVYEQGNGLMNVGAAWNLLKTNIKTVDISSSVPVNTLLSGFLAEPGIGRGINDREGVNLGQSYTRTYTFTRNSGGGGAVTYNVSWVGNDGTFSSAGSISLAKGAATTFVVNVNPTTTGAHSAILNLDDPSTAGIDYQTMNTVVVPEVFTAAGGYTVTKSGTIGRNQTKSFFFRVPVGHAGVQGRFDRSVGDSGTGQVALPALPPVRRRDRLEREPQLLQPGGRRRPTGRPNSRTTTNPIAGVWEVTVEARRTSDVANAPFTLTASILGATVSPNPDTIASATIGVPIARSYTLTNVFGPFTGRAVGTGLGSAFLATPTIANLAQQQYHGQRDGRVDVASRDDRQPVRSGGRPRPLRLQLHVRHLRARRSEADGDSEESVTIANPAAGIWLVLVDGFAVPAGTTTYKYVDVFANPAFGIGQRDRRQHAAPVGRIRGPRPAR